MNCEQVEALLVDFIEGELGEEQIQLVEKHLEGCPGCRTGLHETRALFGALEEARQRQEQSWQSTDHGRSPHPAAAAAVWQPGFVLGDFEILGEVGRGGMGVVYRAKQVSLNRVVALKVLPGMVCQAPNAIQRFKNEAQAAAKLHHTNIVPVYAQGEQDGHFYYAMELIEGRSLDRVARSHTGLTPPLASAEAVVGTPDARSGDGSIAASGVTTRRPMLDYRRLSLMMAGVAEGLDHAHRQGVIHRDIKPQNLLMGEDGELHITDFGLARLLDEPSVTATGEMLGTPAYMSPEQVAADHRKIDHRTDIYSLGATFYELLTRHRPHEGATREQVIARICTAEPRSPRKWDPAIPVDLETICLRAIEKEPRRRYQTAGEFAADLRRYAEDRPILSRRVGPLEKAWKWVRRHPAVTAIVVLSVVLVTVATTWVVQSVQERRARANAMVQRAFDLLAYEDYREPAEARRLLAAARPLKPDELSYRVAEALAALLDEPTTAIANLEWAVAQRPGDPDLMYLLAWALRRDEQHQASHEWLQRAKAAGGAGTAAGHFFHAQAVVRHDPEEAVVAYRNASLERPNYTQAMVHLGRAHNHWMYHYRKHERFIEQERALKIACTLQPNACYPRYLLSIAYRLSAEIYKQADNALDAEEHFGRSLDYAKEAQQVEPNNPLGYVAEAEYWESRGDFAAAVAARDREALHARADPERLDLHQYRWRLLYWMGQIDRAQADLRDLASVCSESDPQRIWYTGLLPSLLQAELGRMPEAVALAKGMADARPTDFRAVTSAASMLRVLQMSEQADELLHRYQERLVYLPDARQWLPREWREATYEFCLGAITMHDLERLAGEDRNNKLLWAAPHFFDGTIALGRNDREAAFAAFRRCELTYDYDDYCYLGKVFSVKMQINPDWPKWIPRPSPVSPGTVTEPR